MAKDTKPASTEATAATGDPNVSDGAEGDSIFDGAADVFGGESPTKVTPDPAEVASDPESDDESGDEPTGESGESEVEPDESDEPDDDTPSDGMVKGDDGVERTPEAHYQREAQLAKTDNGRLKKELEGLQAVKPIHDFIHSNPDSLKVVESLMRGETVDIPSGVNPALPPEPGEKPKPPTEPPGFTIQRAQDDDPDGPFATYLTQYMRYTPALEMWREKKEAYDNAQAQVEYNNQQVAQRRTAMNQGILGVIQKHPLTKDLDHESVLNDVTTFFADQKSLTPQMFVEMYLRASGKYKNTTNGSTGKTIKQKADEIAAKNKGNSAPVPAAVGSDSKSEKATDVDADYIAEFHRNLIG